MNFRKAYSFVALILLPMFCYAGISDYGRPSDLYTGGSWLEEQLLWIPIIIVGIAAYIYGKIKNSNKKDK